ncbi:prolyl oligopeptidase family serine peptidase [Streptosporangium canum]
MMSHPAQGWSAETISSTSEVRGVGLTVRPGSQTGSHRYATSSSPPFLLAHGDLDPQVPAADARHFADRLRQTSAAPVVYAEPRGGNHAFDLYHSVRFEAVVDAIEGFTAWVRSQERTPQP